jgi:hypothetical protein
MLVGIVWWRLSELGNDQIGKAERIDSIPIAGSIWLTASFVGKQLDHRFSESEAIECEILGTKIAGKSQCTGSLVSNVEQAKQHASVRCILKGTIECDNAGKNGPAHIDSKTSTSFKAVKIVSFDGVRFNTRPVELEVETALSITKIDTRLTGIKGVLVKRLAYAKAESTKQEVKTIAEALTKKRLAERIDDEVESQLSNVNFALDVVRSSLLFTMNRELRISTRCIENDLEVKIVLLKPGQQFP